LQQANKTIIESIREFILTCPFLQDWRVNVDYIGVDMSYSVYPLPCQPILSKYVDGGKKKQFQFAFMSKEEYDEDARINIENSGFYQLFDEWMEEQADTGNLPELANEKQHATGIETLNSGYLFDAENQLALYRIECRLLYEQEA
jgi:hypothetical protein